MGKKEDQGEKLLDASEAGDIDAVRSLLADGANVDHPCDMSWTALIYASQEGHTEIVQALVDSGANVLYETPKGKTAPSVAKNQAIKDILDAAASVSASNDKSASLSSQHTLLIQSAEMASSTGAGNSNNNNNNNINKGTLLGIPSIITAEILYQLAKCGHGDKIVIAGAGAGAGAGKSEEDLAALCSHCIVKEAQEPSSSADTTEEILRAVLRLCPLDTYAKEGKMFVLQEDDAAQAAATDAFHTAITRAAGDQWLESDKLAFLNKEEFLQFAQGAFFVIRSNDEHSVIVQKGIVVVDNAA